MNDQRPLGRGLSSLIPKATPRPATVAPVKPIPPPTVPEPAPVRPTAVKPPSSKSSAGPRPGLYDVPVELIDPNPHQPRHAIEPASLDDLVASIKQHGILQPLIVTKQGERYHIVAGERRFRAAQRLGLPSVPAIVRDTRELERLELAIVENVQREDLNPVEEAHAYQQLAEEFGLTQDDIAKKIGKSRTTVANAIRLLQLPAEMLAALRNGTLSASHAKVLLSAVTPADRQRLFDQIMNQQLPVRAAANLGRSTTVRRYTRRKVDPATQAYEDELRGKYGTKVSISKRDGRGHVSIEFYSDEEFSNLINRLRS